jgi:hypothetical protein
MIQAGLHPTAQQVAAIRRRPLTKQRNKHLQCKAAKLAPQNSSALALVYDKEWQEGNSQLSHTDRGAEARRFD